MALVRTLGLMRLFYTDVLEVAGWVQLFYAWRIKVLGASKLWTVLAMSVIPVVSDPGNLSSRSVKY